MIRQGLFTGVLLILLPMLALGAGKIRGKVIDKETKEELIGANVSLEGTTMGAPTGVGGEFIILNVPTGVYTVHATYVGYAPLSIANIRVNTDLTSTIVIELTPSAVSVATVEIVAERPLVNKNATNAVRINTSEDIESIPVRGINNVMATIPGVVVQDNTVFIRGGRVDEVGYYLEGISVTNPMFGGSGVRVAQDALEELQVQAGGYEAEFGGANAGIVQQQLKSGTSSWKGMVQFITDNVSFSPKSKAFDGTKRLGAYWFGYNDMTASLGGPLGTDRIRFFGLFNYTYQRDQTPQPFPGIDIGPLVGQSGDIINLVYPAGPIRQNPREDYTGTGTLSWDLNPVTLRLAGTYTSTKQTSLFNTNRNPGPIADLLDIDRVEQIDQTNGSMSLRLTHMLNSKTYYELTGGYFFQTQRNYDPFLEDNFLAYGDSVANAQAGFVWQRSAADVAGGQTGRYRRPTRKILYDFVFNAPGDLIAGYQKLRRDNISLGGALVTQIGSEHSVKVGGEFQRYSMRGYAWTNDNVFSLANLLATNAALPDGDPNKVTPEQVIVNAGPSNYGYDVWGNPQGGTGFEGPRHPVFAGFYAQDKIEFRDLIINVGLRYDYINTDNYALKDPMHPELAIDPYSSAINTAGLIKSAPYHGLSPRLGISFPVSDRTVFHTQFGQFVQQSRLRDMYQGLYLTAQNIRGGLFISVPVGFDIRPSRTTQYEIGFSQQIGEFASFDITGYYKDIKDQVVYEQQNTAADSPLGAYYVFQNGDFATTKGVELTFTMRREKRLLASASLAFQDARGTGSFPNSGRGIVGAPLEGNTIFRPQYVSPLEYNNAIRGSINLDYRFGDGDGGPILQRLGASALLKFNSGHPFTRGTGGADLEGDARNRQPIEALNSSTTPWVFQVDLRIDKTIRIINELDLNVSLYVINMFDTKNVENVFLRTGSTTDDGVLNNPAFGFPLIKTYGSQYANVYRAINIDYYQRYQGAVGLTTFPLFYGPPRQIRLGLRLEY
jgi:hypothetical protein